MGMDQYLLIPFLDIFRGMNIHLPAILMFTRGTRFWHTAIYTFKKNSWMCQRTYQNQWLCAQFTWKKKKKSVCHLGYTFIITGSHVSCFQITSPNSRFPTAHQDTSRLPADDYPGNRPQPPWRPIRPGMAGFSKDFGFKQPWMIQASRNIHSC